MFEMSVDGREVPRVAYLQVTIEELPRQILRLLGADRERVR